MARNKPYRNKFFAGALTANNILQGARTAYQLYNKFRPRAPQRRPQRGRITDGVGVTTQYDKKTVYYKKRMPYRKKMAWRRFSRKVNAVIEKQMGTRTVVFNNPTQSVNAVGQQATLTIGFFCTGGLADGVLQNYCGLRDLYTLANNDPINRTGKLKFKSGVLDVTFQAANDNPVGLELDVYEFVFNGKEAPFTNVNDIFTQAAAITGPISGAGNSLSIVDRGVTPFDLPEAFSIGHFSIKKKTKYLLPPGNTATYQIRDPRMKVWNKEDLLDDNGTFAGSKKGATVLYAIFKPVVSPGLSVTLNAGVTRKYSYYINESSADLDQRFP